MLGNWHIISPLSEKVGGRIPRVPHLIAPMVVGMALLEKLPVFLLLYLHRWR